MTPRTRRQLPGLARDVAGELLRSLRLPLGLLAAVFGAGALGFWLIGGGRWSLFDCAYMTTITLTGVGYGEVLEPMTKGARTFAMVLMWTGMGAALYAVSMVTAFIVEKRLSNYYRERKMQARLEETQGHTIVCGAGEVGLHIIKEVHASGRTLVVVEDDPERAGLVRQTYPDMLVVAGDATEEEVLTKAGIARAAGLVAALKDDSRNMLITVQARYANPALKIGARCGHNNLVDKFYRAGADYVVNPGFIGGMRIASEMIRPQVVGFLDRMLRGKNVVRMEEVTVRAGSGLAGRELGGADIQGRTGLIPIALRPPAAEEFIYNPGPDRRLEPGTVIIVIGEPGQTSALRGLCAGG